MKKASFPAFLSTVIVCYIFWLVITGQVVAIFTGDAAWQVLVAGALVSILAAAFSARFFIHEKPFYLWNPKRFFSLLVYVFVFLWELTKANIDVARRALSPKLPINPGIVKIPTELTKDYSLSMLANSITLTPGTITMDIVDQDDKTYYYVQCIDAAEGNPAEIGENIKGTMERWIERIWES